MKELTMNEGIPSATRPDVAREVAEVSDGRVHLTLVKSETYRKKPSVSDVEANLRRQIDLLRVLHWAKGEMYHIKIYGAKRHFDVKKAQSDRLILADGVAPVRGFSSTITFVHNVVEDVVELSSAFDADLKELVFLYWKRHRYRGQLQPV